METVARTVAIYLVLLALFRLAGKRSLTGINTFEFVVLLIISEATQQALVSNDYSVTTAILVITTLVGMGLLLNFAKQRSPLLERLLDGVPVVIIHDGKLLEDRMDKLGVDEEDIIEAAHAQAGLESLTDIKYAILERNGIITVIPRRRPRDV